MPTEPLASSRELDDLHRSWRTIQALARFSGEQGSMEAFAFLSALATELGRDLAPQLCTSAD